MRGYAARSVFGAGREEIPRHHRPTKYLPQSSRSTRCLVHSRSTWRLRCSPTMTAVESLDSLDRFTRTWLRRRRRRSRLNLSRFVSVLLFLSPVARPRVQIASLVVLAWARTTTSNRSIVYDGYSTRRAAFDSSRHFARDRLPFSNVTRCPTQNTYRHIYNVHVSIIVRARCYRDDRKCLQTPADHELRGESFILLKRQYDRIFRP